MEYFIDGIAIAIKRKRIKRFRLTVKKEDGSVSFSVPFYATETQISRELESLAPWVRKTREKILKALKEKEKKYEGKILLFGVPYFAEYLLSDRIRADKAGDAIVIRTANGSEKEIKKAVGDLYERELFAYLSKRIPELEKETGLKASSFSITKAKTRWGSCNLATKRLNFSLRLAEKKPYLIDSVIIHELCHTVVFNHQKAFYELIEGFLPNYRRLKKELEKE